MLLLCKKSALYNISILDTFYLFWLDLSIDSIWSPAFLSSAICTQLNLTWVVELLWYYEMIKLQACANRVQTNSVMIIFIISFFFSCVADYHRLTMSLCEVPKRWYYILLFNKLKHCPNMVMVLSISVIRRNRYPAIYVILYAATS